MSETPEQVQTPIGWMWMEDGVLIHRLTSSTVKRDEAVTIKGTVASLTGGRRVPSVIDIRSVAFAERDARSVFAEQTEDSLELATALVVERGASSAMGTIFTKIDKPARPVEMFTSMDEAVRWARAFREEG